MEKHIMNDDIKRPLLGDKVTVITVVYNDVASLRMTIDSVWAQSWKNIEYIIIDGGSTDGTVDIIKEYANRLSYWCSAPDKGVYDAMNKGIGHATGEWICFLNSGDVFSEANSLESMMAVNHEDVDVLYANSIEVSDVVSQKIEASDNTDKMRYYKRILRFFQRAYNRCGKRKFKTP